MQCSSDAKDRLMAAAIALIWERSYSAATIDDICQRASVKKGSFHYFFPGKAELAIATLRHMWSTEWKPFLDTHMSAEKEPAQRFHDYCVAIAAKQSELALQHGKVLGCPVCSLGNEVSTNQPLISAAVRDILLKKRRYYESAIRDALAAGSMEPCEPVETAAALAALIDGTVSQARVLNDASLLKRLPELVMQLLPFRAVALA
jgi:TetR/AcrR family transcriptional repressor of nem operon